MDDGDKLSKGYDYLLGMKIWSLTMERVKLMENELEAKTEEMALLKVPLALLVCSLRLRLVSVCVRWIACVLVQALGDGPCAWVLVRIYLVIFCHRV